jgi:protein-L-isoaspartate(D-aspartate) O-methyltransferase
MTRSTLIRAAAIAAIFYTFGAGPSIEVGSRAEGARDLRAASIAAADRYARERETLIAAIEEDVAATSHEIGRKALDPRVMDAMRRVPRHLFVPESQREHAYANRPLPIGYGQTISQPYIVALMTDLLEPGPGDVVLELGTGSGYQAAVLSGLVKRVYTIEIVPPLAASAKARLAKLGYRNVTVRQGDGYHGWPEHAPPEVPRAAGADKNLSFDAIIVTAAADHVPPPLVRQLKPGGRMVIPIGGPFLTQYLTVVEKDARGRVRSRQLLPVRFVPLRGGR